MKLPVKYDRRHTGTCILIDADGAEICSFGYDDEAKSDAIKVATKLNSHAALVSALERIRDMHALEGHKFDFIEEALALAKGE